MPCTVLGCASAPFRYFFLSRNPVRWLYQKKKMKRYCCGLAAASVAWTSPIRCSSFSSSSSSATGRTPPSFQSLGSSTPFHGRIVTLTPTAVRSEIEALAQLPLTHAVPARVSDHIAIRLVRALRWIADRVFREKLVHRAFVLKLIAPAPGSAGRSVEHWRCTLGSSPTGGTGDPEADVVGPMCTLPNLAGAPTSNVSVDVQTHQEDRAAPASPSIYTEQVRRLLNSFADNQQAHMRVVLGITNASLMERVVFQVTQAAFYAVFLLLFTTSRRFACRMCGYLLEESTVILTHLVNDIDMEKVRHDIAVPHVAVRYWGLQEKGIKPAPLAPTQSIMDAAISAIEVGKDGSDAASRQVTSEHKDDVADDGGDDGTLLSLRDVALLLRADDMYYRDLLHSVANSIDEARSRRGGDAEPRSPFF